MTTQSQPHDCHNCGDSVARRRPSKTGKHWCKRATCQAAKQRWYRQNSGAIEAAKQAEELLEQLKVALVGTLAQSARTVCGSCGRQDAIVDWVHPTPAWNGACRGTGYVGDYEEQLVPYFKAIWPENCPL